MTDQADFGCFPGMDDDNCYFDINSSIPENQNFPNPNYSNLNEDPNEHNSQPVQENSTENTRTSERATNSNASTKAKPRKDIHSRNLPQNISSTIQTQVPKILYGGPMFKQTDIKQCKKRLNDFLKENKAKNNQLVILFAYFFMLQQNASEHQFKELSKDLTKYLNKRIDESAEFDYEDRLIFVEKIEVNKKLVERYFNGCNEAIDLDEVKMICRKLFTGRQENTIQKPLKILAQIQKKMLKEESQFPSNLLKHNLSNHSSRASKND